MLEEILNDDKLSKLRFQRPNRVRARIAIAFLVLTFILQIASLVSMVMQSNLLMEALDGVIISEETAIANDNRVQLLSYFEMGLIIITGIAFIAWFRRAYYNIGQSSKNNYNDGWAAGAWLVPILNWFRPYQIMKELWNKTAQLLELESQRIKTGSAFIGTWWALWIVSSLSSTLIRSLFNNAYDLEALIQMTNCYIAYTILRAAAAIMAIIVIHKYQEMITQVSQSEMH